MHRLLLLTAIIAATLIGAGCASVSSAIQANADGNRSYLARQYQAALSAYELAHRLAVESGDKQYEAIAMYGMARSNAQLCKVGDADRWFRQSIESRSALENTPQAFRTQNMLEYSRFLVAHGRISEAVPYLDRVMKELEGIGVARTDPIGYADALDYYSSALRATGRQEDAAAVTSRAGALRSANAGRSAGFRPQSYPSPC